MKFTSSPKNQYSRPFGKILSWTVFFVACLLLTLSLSKTAHAGLFSFVTSLFDSEHASAKIEQKSSDSNSQTIALLQGAVNHDPNPDKPLEVVPIDNGDVLMADLVSPDSVAGAAVNTQITTYTVKSGDTFLGISRMFNVSVNTILWANSLSKTSTLKVGQTLVILPVSGIVHTVKKGDTINGIVLKYKADRQEVLQYNDIGPDFALKVGETIMIPDVELPTPLPTKIVVKSTGNPAHDTNGPNLAGYYTRPITGGVKTQGLHGYNGVDLADAYGTPIYAAAAGTVIVSSSAGWNGGYGTFIIISHPNGTQTLYAHNSRNLVTVGQSVGQGEKIALMGATGKATGNHVHFEIRGAKNPF